MNLPMTHLIPKGNWADALGTAIQTARPGDTIRVHTEAQAELAWRGLIRLRKDDKVLVVIADSQRVGDMPQ
jgi:hypothetical protein